MSELAHDGDDFLVTEAGPNLAELGTLNELHKNIWSSSGVVRVGGITVNLGSRDSARLQVFDGSHFAGDGVVLGDCHRKRNASDNVLTATLSDDKGTVETALSKLFKANDIGKIVIYGLGCKLSQPVDMKSEPPLPVTKSVGV